MIEITYLDASKQERTMTLNVLNMPASSALLITILSKN